VCVSRSPSRPSAPTDKNHPAAPPIRRNLHSSWVVDRDTFEVNQLGHPCQGSMYHAFARSAGLKYWESLGYAFAGSALWEIAGESSLPSRNDQINTGVGGSFLGEILFRLANLTLSHDSLSPFWRETAAGSISPSTAFNRLAFGDRFKGLFPANDPVYFSRLQIGYSGTVQSGAGASATNLQRNEALVNYATTTDFLASADTRMTGRSTISISKPPRRARTAWRTC
jgi:hypothetical protein